MAPKRKQAAQGAAKRKARTKANPRPAKPDHGPQAAALTIVKLTTEEYNARREKLKSDIRGLIAVFSQETGIKVSGVDVYIIPIHKESDHG